MTRTNQAPCPRPITRQPRIARPGYALAVRALPLVGCIAVTGIGCVNPVAQLNPLADAGPDAGLGPADCVAAGGTCVIGGTSMCNGTILGAYNCNPHSTPEGANCCRANHDAGTAPDSGATQDAGSSTDAGALSDAGDAGSTVDAGMSDAGAACSQGMVSDLNSFVTYTANSYIGIASADLNGDGMLDLVAVDSPPNQDIEVGFDIFSGQLDGGLGTPVHIQGTDGQAIPAIGDLNGDGLADIVVSRENAVNIFFQQSDGGFATPIAQFASIGNISGIGLGDVNGDGLLDLVLLEIGVGENAEVFLNLGAGTFGPPSTIPGGSSGPFGCLLVADFNRDGLADIAMASPSAAGLPPSSVAVLLSQRDGGFAATTYSLVPAYQITSLPRDGALDLAVAQWGPTWWVDGGPLQDGVQVLSNPGAGSGTPYFYPTPKNTGQFLTTGDFNGDGVPDLVVSGYLNCEVTGGGVAVLFGIADGGFQAPVSVPTAGKGTSGVAPLGQVACPHALAIADACDGGITVAGDASKH